MIALSTNLLKSYVITAATILQWNIAPQATPVITNLTSLSIFTIGKVKARMQNKMYFSTVATIKEFTFIAKAKLSRYIQQAAKMLALVFPCQTMPIRWAR